MSADDLLRQETFEENPYVAVLPGYGKEHFEGWAPKPQFNEDVFQPIEPPEYMYEELDDLKPEQTQPGTVWTPADPTSMYMNSLSWCAYPYGIPVDTQPCPYATAASGTSGEGADLAGEGFRYSSSSGVKDQTSLGSGGDEFTESPSSSSSGGQISGLVSTLRKATSQGDAADPDLDALKRKGEKPPVYAWVSKRI